MDPEKLTQYREILLAKLESLIGTAGKTLEELSNGEEAFPDPVDRALTESSRSIELRKRDRERKLIQKIRAALAKIEEGTYGECENCGEEISHERLLARPEASLCINCKEEQEKVEKQFNI
jgi:DnaK suppressor protein